MALASAAKWLAFARALRPVSASTRRTPDATADSPTTEIMPISPVRPTWVPPQSSTDQAIVLPLPSPMATTRTSSPYFSPNSARAPEAGVVAAQKGDYGSIRQHDAGDGSQQRRFTINASSTTACSSFRSVIAPTHFGAK